MVFLLFCMFVSRLIGGRGDIALALRYCPQQSSSERLPFEIIPNWFHFSFCGLVNYVSKSFAKLDTANNIFLKSTLLEIEEGENVLTMNTCALCTVIPV